MLPVPSRATPQMAEKFGPRRVNQAPEQFGMVAERRAEDGGSSRLPLQAATGTSQEDTARRVGQGGSS